MPSKRVTSQSATSKRAKPKTSASRSVAPGPATSKTATAGPAASKRAAPEPAESKPAASASATVTTPPSAAVPAVGAAAPDFTAETDAGERLTLSSLRGRPVVLYFYPKDDTTGCTTEACEFRDLFPRFSAGDAVVLGVSPDSAASHVKFKRKYALPFTLLADTDHAVAEAYGVWGEKQMYGRRYMGVLRTTFVIDRTGRVARVFEQVKPAGHADAVAAAVAELGGGR